MHYFFHPNLTEDIFSLNKEESKHVAILRKLPKDEIYVTDGKGKLVRAVVLSVTKGCIELNILEEVIHTPPNNRLHVAIAPTKNIERIEWFVEKSCEIGIHKISFILCKHSERKKINMERFEKIVISACKQSHKTLFPTLNPLTDFKTFVAQSKEKHKFIAHCNPEVLPHLKEILSPNENLVLIGPEGDFSTHEIHLASQLNYTSVSLGSERLRTETAGLYTCAIYNLLN
ncbi:MAG: 16S rRNA (uracil(1498)-N(3))-methyltransferase [Flavobacteriales bacterium]|nr:16S rRNA (uracil(1498)-N(3))-methyltransferase [Flavobacteriales bacterium]